MPFSLASGYYFKNIPFKVDTEETGKWVMAFGWYSYDISTKPYLMKIGLEGNHLQIISQGLRQPMGTLGWSKDGNYLATSCEDPKNICIFDKNDFIDTSVYPIIEPDYSKVKKTVRLIPDECSKISSDQGLSSISWSKDNEQIFIVCRNKQRSNACIVGVDGKHNCWGEKLLVDMYSKGDWSPTDNLIVIDTGDPLKTVKVGGEYKLVSTGKTINIMNMNGTVKTKLIDGWSPAWSPDGKEIALIRWDEEREYPGLAIIRADGSHFQWLYRPPKRGSDEKAEWNKLSFSPATGCGVSKISWSSDKKFLVVSAAFRGDCNTGLYRVEIKTGKIVPLTTNILMTFTEPEIQP
jgi:WD40 repeat protein